MMELWKKVLDHACSFFYSFLIGISNIMFKKKLVCVLFNAGKGDELTQQCRERILAGLTFENPILCFVGAKTWLMKTICPDKIVIELNNCSDTVGNIKEIKKFIKGKNFIEILIISNHYHLRRIKLLMKIFNLEANVESAEEIIGIKNKISLVEYFLYLFTYIFWIVGFIKTKEVS